MSEQITVIAKFKTKPEAREKLIEIVLKLVRLTREESGCLNYDFHCDLEDPTVFYMHENWRDAAALENHFKQPYIHEAFTAAADVLTEPVEIKRLQMISPEL